MNRPKLTSRGRRMSSRAGFTFIELIVVMCLALVLSTAVLSAAVSSREVNSRVKCARNLKMLGQGMLLYANENNGSMPRTLYAMDSADKPTAFTGSTATDPFKADGPKANDVSAAMFLLLRNEDLVPAVFICPATSQNPWDLGGAKNSQQVSNWPDAKCLSYSWRNPYGSKAAVEAGFKANDALDQKVVLAADGNPGGDDLLHATAKSPEADFAKVNSRNHGGKGQNVLFVDGRVEWQANPFCGPDKDNIYTYGPSGDDKGGDGIVGSSASAKDSVLLPVIGDAK